MVHVAGMTTRVSELTTRVTEPSSRGREALFKHHWAWYFQREWLTIQRKLQLEATSPKEHRSPSAVRPDGLAPCTDIRFDGIGDMQLVDDDLGPEETQMRVLGWLYIGCETLWYHHKPP